MSNREVGLKKGLLFEIKCLSTSVKLCVVHTINIVLSLYVVKGKFEQFTLLGQKVNSKIAETELQRATIDATRTTRHLEETIDNFEKQKIKDIKNILSEFITIEMLFHGKALEVLTAAYQNIQKIDEDEDLEVFRNSLYLSDYPSRLDIVRANSKSPLQRPLSTKCTSGTGQIATCRTKKDQHVEDEDDEELDVTEDEN